MFRKIILIGFLVVAVLWLAGCQTVAGVGGDLKWSAESTANLLSGGD